MHEGNPAPDQPGASSVTAPARGWRKALDPYIKLMPFVGIGIVVVALAVGSILWMQGGAHVHLTGSIQKVRTLAVEDTGTLAVADLRVQNPSDYQFIVRSIQMFLTTADGQEVEGQNVSEKDAKAVFQYYPALGQKYNDTLLIRTKIAPGKSLDRMLAARFELPEAKVQARKQLRIHIVELDSPVENDILEKR